MELSGDESISMDHFVLIMLILLRASYLLIYITLEFILFLLKMFLISSFRSSIRRTSNSLIRFFPFYFRFDLR